VSWCSRTGNIADEVDAILADPDLDTHGFMRAASARFGRNDQHE
jgi:hypothetical protein